MPPNPNTHYSILIMDFGRCRETDELGNELLVRKEFIEEGDLVLLHASHDTITHVYVKRGECIHNRFGLYPHESLIGQRFGTRLKARSGTGFLLLLAPTPELWAKTLPTRTQIVQDSDQALLILRLGLKPGDMVVESGTGSGAMSTAIIRAIAPNGILHTFDFHGKRVKEIRSQFERNGLKGLYTVTQRDVCRDGYEIEGRDHSLCGKVDAVFLDLPQPWEAVKHARRALKPSGRLASYSPCVEQVQKTYKALRKEGFCE